MPIALKEWAVTVRALAEGEQLVTLRKGGIREENKHFEVEHDRFFLYPTFDHQRNDLVRESHHPELRRALEEGVWPDEEPPPRALLQDGGIAQPDRVRIRSWAEVADHFETDDPRIVDSLSPFHVWTQDYAHKRLRWKPRHPIHVLLLRVYRIPRPVTVRVRDEYHGCRSWVEIDRELPFEGTPVMADEEFVRAAAEIRAICDARRARPSLTIVPHAGDFAAVVRGAERALVLGIGGGGDVVGALAVARLCESLGTPFVLGGVAWERTPVDPHPGPRPLAEIRGGRPAGRRGGARRARDGHPAGSRVLRGANGGPPGRRDRAGGRERRARRAPRQGSRAPSRSWAATCWSASTSAATCSPTGTSRGWRARFATR